MATASAAWPALPGKIRELWLGGDVNLGNGGRAQLQGISWHSARRGRDVNLEGPAAQPASSSCAYGITPKALEELLAVHVRVAESPTSLRRRGQKRTKEQHGATSGQGISPQADRWSGVTARE